MWGSGVRSQKSPQDNEGKVPPNSVELWESTLRTNTALRGSTMGRKKKRTWQERQEARKASVPQPQNVLAISGGA